MLQLVVEIGNSNGDVTTNITAWVLLISTTSWSMSDIYARLSPLVAGELPAVPVTGKRLIFYNS